MVPNPLNQFDSFRDIIGCGIGPTGFDNSCPRRVNVLGRYFVKGLVEHLGVRRDGLGQVHPKLMLVCIIALAERPVEPPSQNRDCLPGSSQTTPPPLVEHLLYSSP